MPGVAMGGGSVPLRLAVLLAQYLSMEMKWLVR